MKTAWNPDYLLSLLRRVDTIALAHELLDLIHTHTQISIPQL